MSTGAKMLTKMLATLCRIPEICASVVVAEKSRFNKPAVQAVSKNTCRRMNGWSISSFALAQFCPTGFDEPAVVTKVRRQASEDVARMLARTASACQRRYCGCALPLCRVSHLLHFMSQTPVGSKRKKKRKSTHQWPQLLNTTWFTPSGHKMSPFKKKKKKRATCSAHMTTSQREQTLWNKDARAVSVHVRHVLVEVQVQCVNVVIGVVLGELHVVFHLVPLVVCDDAAVRRTLVLIAIYRSHCFHRRHFS